MDTGIAAHEGRHTGLTATDWCAHVVLTPVLPPF